MSDYTKQPKANGLALLPFLVFLVFYLGLSLWAHDFYKVPMPIAFVVASAAALFLNLRRPLSDKVDTYAAGMGDANIMIMCLIFILAGAFATIAKGMGAVNAAVEIAQALIPSNLMLAGFFLIACFISLAIGTSCGTIAALTPIAVGLVEPMQINPGLMIAAVVGGAMFGDNLSVISDTTIAATRTQGVAMRDKLIQNSRIAIPPAVVALVVYALAGKSGAAFTAPAITWNHILLVTPYLLILLLAFLGMNVMLLLFSGSLLAAVIGNCLGKFDFWGGLKLVGDGTLGMSETLIVAILAGGLLGTIRQNGGIQWVMEKIERAVGGARGCEFGVWLLVSAVNFITANNTVAIVVAGPIARDLADRFHCRSERIASILDTGSCIVQGLIPYGAQILIAVGLAKTAGFEISGLHIISHLYYQAFLAVAVAVWILLPSRDRAKR
ncbi:MAG: Na+/H+ antiporter NhaC family protein [Kiritimatiellae bacterium]|nr:Na+/H+ antiporter NhaC family protein [Kiritimatiellia bacterium]